MYRPICGLNFPFVTYRTCIHVHGRDTDALCQPGGGGSSAYREELCMNPTRSGHNHPSPVPGDHPGSPGT